MRFAAGGREGLKRLSGLGVPLVVVSNQPCVELGICSRSDLARVERQLNAMFSECGAKLSGFYFCPHRPRASSRHRREGCHCRKPQPGLLLRAAAQHRFNLSHSWMVGDILDDIEAGRRAGCRTILIANGSETVWRSGPLRRPHYSVADFFEAACLIAAENAATAPPSSTRS